MTSLPEKLYGRYFPPGTAESFDATLEERGGDLIVTINDTQEETLVVFHELGDRLGSLPRKIAFQDGSVFECPDNDAVDLAFGKGRHFASRLTKAEGSLKFAVIACIATIFLIAGIYRYGLPILATVAAWATPTTMVELIDDGVMDTVDQVLFNPSNMAVQEQEKYRTVFVELLDAAELDQSRFDLLFRDGGRLGANAMALPGGTIIMTDQLAELSEHEDEIAGVLAHEIGHVTERHSLRQIYRALGIGFMIALVIGDTSQLLDNIVGQAALLDTLSYSRQFEADADTESVRIMLRAGRDPVAFVDLLDRIFEDAGIESQESGWLSTHPDNEDRRENVEQQVERLR